MVYALLHYNEPRLFIRANCTVAIVGCCLAGGPPWARWNYDRSSITGKSGERSYRGLLEIFEGRREEVGR